MSLFPPRLRRALTLGAALLVFLMLVGATYQGVATALERRDFGHPGGLVGIGDHQLHIYCVGDGSPIVLLEAPAGGLSAAWTDVQNRVSATTRVCSYDRSGLGWSEAGDRPFDPGRVPEELRTLLTAAKEGGPYVVAGHGLGALFARMYAARNDSEVVALVLVDPPAESMSPDWWERALPAAPWLARVGIVRLGGLLSDRAEHIPGIGGASVRAFLNRPDHLTRTAAEVRKWDDAVRISRAATLPPDLPVLTLETGRTDRLEFLSGPAIDQVVSTIEHTVALAREAR